ncbi:MAG: hypothetical protein WBX15_06000 [Thermoanaerobaculia bacterium]
MSGAPGRIPDVCHHLRTKQTAATVIDGAALPWQMGENASACYWCIATTGPVGPDERPVHPRSCLDGRSCWRGTPAG